MIRSVQEILDSDKMEYQEQSCKDIKHHGKLQLENNTKFQKALGLLILAVVPAAQIVMRTKRDPWSWSCHAVL
jgi:hypothetical protein